MPTNTQAESFKEKVQLFSKIENDDYNVDYVSGGDDMI